MTLSISEQLSDLLGGTGQIVPPERLEEYAVDGLAPQGAVRPASPQEVAEIMRWASSERLAVLPWGGGTRMFLGNTPRRVDLIVDLSRCNRLLDYQPDDLTATVEAGISLESLQHGLAPGGKFLPVEAPQARRATIGGILATSASGPLRFAYGLPRDWLIGISVVSAQGVETRAGGKVVKNVTGYDLNKLYTGSLGTLGVIVEATFKLAPLAPEWGALTASFPSLAAGMEASRQLLRQAFAPQGLLLANGQAARRIALAPDGRESGGGDLPSPIGSVAGGEGLPPSAPATAFAFFSGRSRAVQRKLEEASRLLWEQGAADLVRLDGPAARSLLQGLTDLGWNGPATPYLALRVSVPPSEVGRVVDQCQQDTTLGLPPGIVADSGFGTVQLLWWAESVSEWIDESPVVAAISRVRELARQCGGTAVVEHCPLTAKRQIDVWGDAPEGIEIMRRIKQRFDPLGILNPGRFVGRI